MSRRRERGRRREEGAASKAGGGRRPVGPAGGGGHSGGGGHPARPPGGDAADVAQRDRGRGGGLGLLAQLGLVIAAFAVTVGVAELAGAANLGVSFGIGQVVFTIVLLVVLIRA